MSIENDRAIIERLGGPARVAEMLKLNKFGGVQRVSNWVRRGIPAQVKLDHPDIFLTAWPELAQKEEVA